MSNFFYELVDATTIKFWQLSKTYIKADMQQDSSDIDDLLALTDNEKELVIAGSRIYQSVDDFDSKLGLQQQKLDEIINYLDYNTAATSFDRITGDFITPETVYDKCGEDAINIAAQSIDGNSGNYWQHDVDELHWIVYDLGMSLADITQISIALGGGDGNEFKLAGVDVYVTDSVDDFGTPVGSSLNFQTNGVWNTENLTNKQGRYIKLDNIDMY